MIPLKRLDIPPVYLSKAIALLVVDASPAHQCKSHSWFAVSVPIEDHTFFTFERTQFTAINVDSFHGTSLAQGFSRFEGRSNKTGNFGRYMHATCQTPRIKGCETLVGFRPDRRLHECIRLAGKEIVRRVFRMRRLLEKQLDLFLSFEFIFRHVGCRARTTWSPEQKKLFRP